MNLFASILAKYPMTDKLNGFYEKAYEDSFFLRRGDVKLVFEIGVNRGGSVRSFRDYFPNALIVGVDINPGSMFTEDRVKIEIGNASQKDFVDSLVAKYGHPDIVVDDGSHFSHEIKASFNLLYPITNFCYVIEDLGTQYPQYEKGFYITDQVPATALIHQKIDELMQSRLSTNIRFYHSICFMFK